MPADDRPSARPMAFWDGGLLIAYPLNAYCLLLTAYRLQKLFTSELTRFELPLLAKAVEGPMTGGAASIGGKVDGGGVMAVSVML